MEIKDVIELIKAVSDNGLTGFKIEQGDTKIVIKKEQPAVIQAVPALAGCRWSRAPDRPDRFRNAVKREPGQSCSADGYGCI